MNTGRNQSTARIVHRVHQHDVTYCEINGQKWFNSHQNGEILGEGVDGCTRRFNPTLEGKHLRGHLPKVIKTIRKIHTGYQPPSTPEQAAGLEALSKAQKQDVLREVAITAECLGECQLVEETDQFILVLNYIAGDKLVNFLTHRWLSFSAFLAVCRATLMALNDIHQKDVVHGDYHDGNILVEEKGFLQYAVKGIDFGLARKKGELTSGRWDKGIGMPDELKSAVKAHPSQDIYRRGYCFNTTFEELKKKNHDPIHSYIEVQFRGLCKWMQKDIPNERPATQEIITAFKRLEVLNYFCEFQHRDDHFENKAWAKDFRDFAKFDDGADLYRYLLTFVPDRRATMLQRLDPTVIAKCTSLSPVPNDPEVILDNLNQAWLLRIDPAFLTTRDFLDEYLEQATFVHFRQLLETVPENKRFIIANHCGQPRGVYEGFNYARLLITDAARLKTFLSLLPAHEFHCYNTMRQLDIRNICIQYLRRLPAGTKAGAGLQRLLDTIFENAGAKREVQQYAFLKAYVMKITMLDGVNGSNLKDAIKKLACFKDNPALYQNLLFVLAHVYRDIRAAEEEYTGFSGGFHRDQKVEAVGCLIRGNHDLKTIENLRKGSIYANGNVGRLTSALLDSFALFKTTPAGAPRVSTATAATAAAAEFKNTR